MAGDVSQVLAYGGGTATLLLIWLSGTHHYLSWRSLAANQAVLAAWVARNALLAPVVTVLIYAFTVALSVPGAVVLTLASGLLFGTVLGGAVAVMGATLGALLVFLAARTALADFLNRKFGTLIARMRPGLERDGFYYLLSIRLVPLFPFWLVNLAPALVGMRLVPYVLATFLGIIPPTIVFAAIGAGIGSVLEAGKEPDLSIILTPSVLLPRLGLAALSLVPVLWRRKADHG